MSLRRDQEETLIQAMMAEQERICLDLLCYGRTEYNVDELIDEVVLDRVGPGLWPTRGQGDSDAEC